MGGLLCLLLGLSLAGFTPRSSEKNLVTDFLEATSLPVNVPIHRSREASRPSTPMREEFDRCTKQLPFSLASKLFSGSSLADQMEEENEMKRGLGKMVEKRKRKTTFRGKNQDYDGLMFSIDL